MHRTRGPPEAQTPDPGTLSPHPAPPSLDQRKVYTLAGRRSRCAMCLRTGTPPARTTRAAAAVCEPLLDAHTVSNVHDPFKFKLDYLNLKYLIGCESFRFTTWRDVSEISCCVTKA